MSSNQNIGIECGAGDEQERTFTSHQNRETHLDSLKISRALPIRERRMVGPWCFLDRFGPLSFENEKPMAVPPHPHIGLQTVSFLLEGEIQHTDSLGSEAILSPGGVNVMTAGRGIAHAEETPAVNSGSLNGLQLWVALPDEHRHTAPSFTHIPQVPIIETNDGLIQIFAGAFNNDNTPLSYYSEIIGMTVQVHPQHSLDIETDPQFEHALLVLDGDCALENERLTTKMLYYLGACRESLNFYSSFACTVNTPQHH